MAMGIDPTKAKERAANLSSGYTVGGRAVADPSTRIQEVTGNLNHDSMVVCIAGPEKHGKTHIALTAPGPIYCQSLDTGTDDIVHKYIQGGPFWDGSRTIHLYPPYSVDVGGAYDFSDADSEPMRRMLAEAAGPVWDQWVADYLYALDHARTIIWDTESEAWELLRLARFGILNPKTGRDRGNVWGPVNAEYRRLIRLGSDKGVNFALIQKVKDEYANDKKTGRKERKGFADIGYMAQVVVWATRSGSTFTQTVTDCRQNPDLNGMELPDNNWETLRSLVMI